MKIAFYIHHTTISAGGIYTYTIGILRQLLNSPELDKIIIVTSKEISETLDEFRSRGKIEIRIVDRQNFLVNLRMLTWYGLYVTVHLISDIFNSSSVLNRAKYLISKINPYNKIILKDEVEIFHVPIQYSPIYKIDVPVVITMHDLQEYHYPKYFSFKERLHRRINNKIAINDSDHTVCSFDHVKNDIIKYFKIDPKRVSVCPPPFADNWFLNKNESDWDLIQKKYSIKKSYILYPAATWKHKNHRTLIEAVNHLKQSNFDVELICTGNKTNYFSTIVEIITRLNLDDAVHFLGIVPEEDLISLYKNSSLVVIPTLYEAGSGPLYEAMRYQVPVICSNVTSLPDTIGNKEFLFDPSNADELARKIKTMLTNPDLRKSNVENSIKRMEKLREVDYAKNFINLYKNLAPNNFD